MKQQTYKDGWTPLHYAALKNSVGVVHMLLEKGADVNVQDKRGQMSLRKAVMNDDVDSVRPLARKGVSLTTHDQERGSPVHWAVRKNNMDLVRQFVDLDGDINIQNKVGQTPLYYEVLNNSVGVVHELLVNGADLNVQDKGRVKPSPSASKRKNGNLPKKGAEADGQKIEGEKTLPSVSKRKSGNLPMKGVTVDGRKTEKQNHVPLPSKRKNGNPPKKGAEFNGHKNAREKPSSPDSKRKSENLPKKRAKLSGQKTIGHLLAHSLGVFIIGLMMVLTILPVVGASSTEIQVNVESPVIVPLSATNAVIRCSFTTNNNTNVDILWLLEDNDKEDAMVINRESGQDFQGSYYNGTVYMEPDSCTLVFTNLRKDYSGNYSVSVFGGNEGYASAKVRLIILQPKTTASLSVQSSVEIKLPVTTAVLPCNYTVPEDVLSDDEISIVWTRHGVNGPRVLEKDSGEKVKVFEAVHLGKGCSLILEDPGVNDTGIFTVTLYHGRNKESRDVEVNVSSDGLTPHTKGVHDSGPRVTVVVFGVIIPVVLCIIGILILWICHRRSVCIKTKTEKTSAKQAEAVPLRNDSEK